jgi:hypothetical protein
LIGVGLFFISLLATFRCLICDPASTSFGGLASFGMWLCIIVRNGIIRFVKARVSAFFIVRLFGVGNARAGDRCRRG